MTTIILLQVKPFLTYTTFKFKGKKPQTDEIMVEFMAMNIV